jgi:cytidylate kinase
MNLHPSLDKCLTFINCQIEPKAAGIDTTELMPYRAVTISRQSGSGGHVVAEKLGQYLQSRAPGESCPWTVFDRNLVEKVLEDHNLPTRLAQFMPEDKVSDISDAMDELFGLHPSSWDLVKHTAQTILRLANLGRVIIIGRGANVITASLDHVFHVRLVAPVNKRAEYLQELEKLSRKAALDMIRREDRGRARYLLRNYGADIDDPLLYHLVINTELVGYEETARIIGDAMLGTRTTARRSKTLGTATAAA